MNLRFSGAYQVRVLRPDGSVRLETEFFDNLITNSGLDRLGGTYGNPYAYVTTGTTPPAETDTTFSGTLLGRYQLSIAVYTTQYASLPNYAQVSYTVTFPTGAIVGAASELSIGDGTSTSITRLFSRALIANSQGVPITITLTATDQLQIVYMLRQYIPDADTSFDLDVNGVTRTFTVRPCEIDTTGYGWAPDLAYEVAIASGATYTRAYSGGIGTRTASPSGTAYNVTSNAMTTYVAGTYRRGFYLIWLPSAGTFTAASFKIQSAYSCAGTWQLGVSPSIVKTNLQTLRIEGEYSWGRYVP